MIRALKDFISPSDALSSLGVKPADVTDIIISHMHWDHVDGVDLFPNAHVWIQRDEYAYYTGEAWHTDTHGGLDPEDVLTMVRLNTAGRVTIVDGDNRTLFPGITCYIGGKHTFQSQFLSVRSDGGTIVLASDALYLYENLDQHVPIGTTLDAAANLRAQDRMKRIASRPDLIVPGHDPAVFERFSKRSDRVVQIRPLTP
jgi:glyoxylase-like metal-dependent hydrolase (beta-lactamase superfamily II)